MESAMDLYGSPYGSESHPDLCDAVGMRYFNNPLRSIQPMIQKGLLTDGTALLVFFFLDICRMLQLYTVDNW